MFLKVMNENREYCFINLSQVKYINSYFDKNETDEFLKHGIYVAWQSDTDNIDDNEVYFGVTIQDLHIGLNGNLFFEMSWETSERNKIITENPFKR